MFFQILLRFNCFLQNRFSGKYISRFQNWSLVLRIEIEHSHRIEFSFRNRCFVSKLLFQFKVKLFHPELKFCFRNRSCFFGIAFTILETSLPNWVVIRCWKRSFEFEFFSKLETKFQFQKRRFDSVSKVSILKNKLQFWKRGIYLPEKQMTLLGFREKYSKCGTERMFWKALAMDNGHFFSKLRRNIKSLVVKYFPNLIGNQCLFKILHTSSTETTRKDAEKVNVSKYLCYGERYSECFLKNAAI